MALTANEKEITDQVRRMLGFLEKVCVYDEIGVPTDCDRDIFQFTYRNWISGTEVRAHINDQAGSVDVNFTSGCLVKTNQYTLDTDLGQVTLTSHFPTGLPTGDTLRATYTFQYFQDAELESFLDTTISLINGRKPATTFATVNDVPRELDGSLIFGVYVRCLERVLFDSYLWKGALIYADTNMLRQMLSSMYMNALQEFDKQATKPRSLGATPRSVSSGKYYTQQRVTNVNFRRFTIISDV